MDWELLRSLSQWMRILGFVSILFGILSCLSLVGILWGWLPIVMGLFLLRGADAFLKYAQLALEEGLGIGLANLRDYFRMQVIVLILIAMAALLLTVAWLANPGLLQWISAESVPS